MTQNQDLDLLPPESLNRSLWRSLLGNLRDKFATERLPPLQLTSRPVDVGMLEGDRLAMPWYRTVFTNIGDVLSPESLPPLELESRPVDVGELVADQMSHMWWTSLLRNLADNVAPERQPALQLTSAPVNPSLHSDSEYLLLPQWSSVIDGPKVFLPDKPKAAYPSLPRIVAVPVVKPNQAEVEFVHVLESDLRRDLRRSTIRVRLWISFAAIQVIVLIGGFFWFK
ncbi:MAG: TonB family protein [Acidobacteriaceae bacterium]|nr:TonB family protein [Acidobacteriaceae bacterium]